MNLNLHWRAPRHLRALYAVRPLVALTALLFSMVLRSRAGMANPTAKPLRIMCIGASITLGQGVNGGYRLPLEKLFEGAGIPVQFVGRVDSNSNGMTSPFHEGYPGHRIDQIETGATNTFKITSLPIAAGVRELRPDVILLLCGTNDVRQGFQLEEAASRLDHLVGTLQGAAPDAQIFVSNIPADLHHDDAVRGYDAAVARMVANRSDAGQKVHFVDTYSALNPGLDLSADRTHPNRGGYFKIARNWFRALEPGAGQIAFSLTNRGANEFEASSCLGYKITMKAAATVTDLGLYCGAKALPAAHAVGVFNETGHELARVTIAPEGVPKGLFVYQKLADPLVLEKGKSYYFASNSVGLPALVGTDAMVDPLHLEDPRFYFDHNISGSHPETGTELPFPGSEIHDINGALGYFGPIFRLAP